MIKLSKSDRFITSLWRPKAKDFLFKRDKGNKWQLPESKKEAQVKLVSDDLAKSKMTVLANYQGLSVAQIQALRKLLKAAGCQIRVIKNTLIKLAIEQNPNLKNIDTHVFNGPVALIFGYEDEAAAAQICAQFAKENILPQIFGALSAEGQLLSAEQANQLANLPAKPQLLSLLVGTIAAPMSGFVNVLNGNIRGLVQVLNSFKESQAKSN